MTRHSAEPPGLPWPLLRVARRLVHRASPPDLLLFFAEALEEAAGHADDISGGRHPYTRGLRNLAAEMRAGVPIRDDTPHDPELSA